MIPSVDVIEITDKLVRYVRVEQKDEHNKKSPTWIADVNIDWWDAEYKEPTTKNDLGVDCISRKAVLSLPKRTMKNYFGEVVGEVINVKDIMDLSSVTPQEPLDRYQYF